MSTRTPPSDPRPRSQPQNRREAYLTAYNALSCALWVAVLGRVLLLVPLVGYEEVYNGVGEWTKWTQTLMVVEVLHAGIGEFSRLRALASVRVDTAVGLAAWVSTGTSKWESFLSRKDGTIDLARHRSGRKGSWSQRDM